MIRPSNPNYWNLARSMRGPFRDADAFYGTDYGLGLTQLLDKTNAFDSIAVGRKADENWLSSEHRVAAIFEVQGVRFENDGTPGTRIRVVPYSLIFEVHETWQETAYNLLDQLESIALNALMSKTNREYGGFCLPWLSRLSRSANQSYNVPDKRRQLSGQFGYRVPSTMSDDTFQTV